MKKYFVFFSFFFFIIFVIWEANHNGTNFIFRSVEQIPFKDKVGHFGLYGLLAFLLDWALNEKNMRLIQWNIPTSIILVLAFALLEEITQYWIPARNFDPKDAVADLFGIVFFVMGSRFLQAKFTRVYSAFYTPTKKSREGLK